MDNSHSEQIKREMREGYDRQSSEYGTQRNSIFDAFLHSELEHFAGSVKAIGTRVIDLGSGPGNEALMLQDLGLNLTCIDMSPRMVEQCRSKGLEAHEMDFYNLQFPDGIFDGAWMAFAFLHVPKRDAMLVLSEIQRVLKPGGILCISLFEGSGEGLRKEDRKRFGIERYFSYYTTDELIKLLSQFFDVTFQSRLDTSPRSTISFECTKRTEEQA